MQHGLDVLLINSPRYLNNSVPEKNQIRDSRVPLGLMYISSYLKSMGQRVDILDAEANDLSVSEIMTCVQEKEPGIIGLNCHTANRYTVYELVNLFKAINPEIMLVAGGAHPTIAAEQTLKECQKIDVLVIGEGEHTFFELTEHRKSIENVAGIAYLGQDGSICFTRPRSRINNLDELPFPNPKDINYEQYLRYEDMHLKGLWGRFYIMATRGCKFRCSYCTQFPFWTGNTTCRSAKNVIEEIAAIVKWCKDMDIKFGHRKIRFYFYDDTLTDWPHLFEFCDRVQPLEIDWSCSCRIEHLADFDLISKMSKAGCREIAIGLESGSKKILNKVRKRWMDRVSKEKVGQIIKTCNEKGICPRTHFIIGLPWENRKDINDTVEFAVSLKEYGLSDANFFPAKIFPGTELYHNVLDMLQNNQIQHKREISNSIFIKDWQYIENLKVKSKAIRFNDIPEMTIHPNLDSMALRRLTLNAYKIFFSNSRPVDVKNSLWQGIRWSKGAGKERKTLICPRIH